MNVPSWPIPGSAEATKFFAAAREVANAWKALGVSHPYILAMVAQAEAESTFDPNEMGDWTDSDGRQLPWARRYPTDAKPASYGLYQWKDARLDAIKAAIGLDLKAKVLAGTATIADAVKAAVWELSPTGPQSVAGAAIAAQHTAYMASYEACVLFERASAPSAATRRANMAERWAVWFQDNGGI